MPWKEVKPMDEKVHFISDYLRQTDNFSRLCERFGISRKTGYKWIERYGDDGMEGLNERSSRRHRQEQQTPHVIREAILELRELKDPPGPKKIQAMLGRRFKEDEIPSATTIYNILKKAGKVESKRRRAAKPAPYPGPLRSTAEPNGLWSVDYKGQFTMADGRWCYPLTVMDHASRYLLGCEGLDGTTHAQAQRVFERLFREYGLPERIRSDNGTPFASNSIRGLSRLSIWWIRLNIRPERIVPGKPQQNGRHERMHRTLKRAVNVEVAANLQQQKHLLEAFRSFYNEQRPHEGLGQRSPQECYVPSPRPYPARLPELQYPSYVQPLKVHNAGVAYWRGVTIYVGNVLGGEIVGVEAVGDGVWAMHFGPIHLGNFNERSLQPGDYLRLNV